MSESGAGVPLGSGLPMDQEIKTLEAADIAKILQALPHRYPFLMVDRIRDIDGDDFGIGIKNVTFNEPHFQGHFPGHPVMPGVLLIEGMAQTAGALCVLAHGLSGPPKLVYFMTIDNAKFRKPVIPGDTVEYHVRKIRRRSNIWKFAGEAWVAGVKVAEAEVTAMLVDG
jgi:3-hydroxyacyl-[acyl-carrier-protein] dehydratase